MTEFEIINSKQKILCFIGRSSMTKAIVPTLQSQFYCEIISTEDLNSQNARWFDQRAFIILSSDVKFKMQTIAWLSDINPTYFSMISKQNCLGSDTKIGEGTCVFPYNNTTIGPVIIGRHCVVGSYNIFSHNTVFGDFCHTGHYGFFTNCKIGTGNVFGIRPIIRNNDASRSISTAEFCNFISDSAIKKDVLKSGTYYGNRQLNEETSITKRIL